MSACRRWSSMRSNVRADAWRADVRGRTTPSLLPLAAPRSCCDDEGSGSLLVVRLASTAAPFTCAAPAPLAAAVGGGGPRFLFMLLSCALCQRWTTHACPQHGLCALLHNSDRETVGGRFASPVPPAGLIRHQHRLVICQLQLHVNVAGLQKLSWGSLGVPVVMVLDHVAAVG